MGGGAIPKIKNRYSTDTGGIRFAPGGEREREMNFKKGYELERLVSKLRIRGLHSDAAALEKNRSTNGLGSEALRIVREEAR